MHSTNIWDKYNLLGRKIIFALLLVMPCLLNAQHNTLENDMRFKKRHIKFGIHMGFNVSNFRAFRNEAFIQADSLFAINAENGTGFNLGIVSSLYLHKNLELRFIPTLVFSEKTLRYEFENSSMPQKLESVTIEFPLQVKFKSDPIKDFRIYVIGGMKYGLDLAAKSQARNAENIVKLNKSDFAVEYGVGFEINFPLFILVPEFKVSNGILDVHSRDPNLIFSNTLDRLKNRSFTFSLNFEG
ncbi:MAG: PorT family protein [Bacteroidetes bacterium]|nr:PorT family protein [Bacteroidota bacterium]